MKPGWYAWPDTATELSVTALQHDYDGLFLVDSDLILHPQLLEYLRASGKKAVSELFWIKNRLGTLSRPNAWLMEKRALDSDSRQCRHV